MRRITDENVAPPSGTEGTGTLFRTEALEEQARSSEPAGLVALDPGWASWAFYGLVIGVLALITAASIIRIERTVTGLAAQDPSGRVIIVVPASNAVDIVPGDRVIGLQAVVDDVGDRILSPSQVRDRYGIDVTVASVAVAATSGAPQAPSGPVTIDTGAERLIVALIPGLQALFGEERA